MPHYRSEIENLPNQQAQITSYLHSQRFHFPRLAPPIYRMEERLVELTFHSPADEISYEGQAANAAHSHQHEPTSQPDASSNDQEAQMISVAEHASLPKCSSSLATEDLHKMDKA